MSLYFVFASEEELPKEEEGLLAPTIARHNFLISEMISPNVGGGVLLKSKGNISIKTRYNDYDLPEKFSIEEMTVDPFPEDKLPIYLHFPVIDGVPVYIFSDIEESTKFKPDTDPIIKHLPFLKENYIVSLKESDKLEILKKLSQMS